MPEEDEEDEEEEDKEEDEEESEEESEEDIDEEAKSEGTDTTVTERLLEDNAQSITIHATPENNPIYPDYPSIAKELL